MSRPEKDQTKEVGVEVGEFTFFESPNKEPQKKHEDKEKESLKVRIDLSQSTSKSPPKDDQEKGDESAIRRSPRKRKAVDTHNVNRKEAGFAPSRDPEALAERYEQRKAKGEIKSSKRAKKQSPTPEHEESTGLKMLLDAVEIHSPKEIQVVPVDQTASAAAAAPPSTTPVASVARTNRNPRKRKARAESDAASSTESDLESESDPQEHDKSHLEKAKKATETALSNLEKDYGAFATSISNLRNTLEKQTSAIERQYRKITHLEQQKSGLKACAEKAEQEAKSLRKKLKEANATEERMIDQIHASTQRTREKDREISSLARREINLKGEISKLKGEITEAKKKIHALNTQNSHNEFTINTIDAEKKDLQQKEGFWQRKANALTGLNSQQKEIIDRQERELQKRNTKIKELQATLNRVAQERSSKAMSKDPDQAVSAAEEPESFLPEMNIPPPPQVQYTAATYTATGQAAQLTSPGGVPYTARHRPNLLATINPNQAAAASSEAAAATASPDQYQIHSAVAAPPGSLPGLGNENNPNPKEVATLLMSLRSPETTQEDQLGHEVIEIADETPPNSPPPSPSASTPSASSTQRQTQSAWGHG